MDTLALDNENRTPLKSTEELLMIVAIDNRWAYNFKWIQNLSGDQFYFSKINWLEKKCITIWTRCRNLLVDVLTIKFGQNNYQLKHSLIRILV